MQRSSPSIGTLAAALAKAQGELVNPEKSLAATIRGGRPRPARADLPLRAVVERASRSCARSLGRARDCRRADHLHRTQAAGIINLTTVLAHASGEWIASDWPVCADHRDRRPRAASGPRSPMRAATPSSRSSGLAGEDDLDAPDLSAPANRTAAPDKTNGGTGQPGGGQQNYAPRAGLGRNAKTASNSASSPLDHKHRANYATGLSLRSTISPAVTTPQYGRIDVSVKRTDEAAWWRKTGIDPTLTARLLWLESHPPMIRSIQRYG